MCRCEVVNTAAIWYAPVLTHDGACLSCLTFQYHAETAFHSFVTLYELATHLILLVRLIGILLSYVLATEWTIRSGREFSCPFRATSRPTHPPVLGIPGLSPGLKWSRYDADQPHPSSTEIVKVLEIYLHLRSEPGKACYGVTFTFHLYAVRNRAKCLIVLLSHELVPWGAACLGRCVVVR